MTFELRIHDTKLPSRRVEGGVYLCRIVAGSLDEHFEASALMWEWGDYAFAWRMQLRGLLETGKPAVLLKSVYCPPTVGVFAGYYLVAPSTHDHFCVFEFLVPIGEEFAQANWDQFIDACRLDVPEPNEPISRWMVEASDIFGFARRDLWLSDLMLRLD